MPDAAAFRAETRAARDAARQRWGDRYAPLIRDVAGDVELVRAQLGLDGSALALGAADLLEPWQEREREILLALAYEMSEGTLAPEKEAVR